MEDSSTSYHSSSSIIPTASSAHEVSSSESRGIPSSPVSISASDTEMPSSVTIRCSSSMPMFFCSSIIARCSSSTLFLILISTACSVIFPSCFCNKLPTSNFTCNTSPSVF
uniref:Dull1 n=1 Tax=Arundo donax TaxID=35708 RepID=A0A0A9BHW8_ARUDO